MVPYLICLYVTNEDRKKKWATKFVPGPDLTDLRPGFLSCRALMLASSTPTPSPLLCWWDTRWQAVWTAYSGPRSPWGDWLQCTCPTDTRHPSCSSSVWYGHVSEGQTCTNTDITGQEKQRWPSGVRLYSSESYKTFVLRQFKPNIWTGWECKPLRRGLLSERVHTVCLS